MKSKELKLRCNHMYFTLYGFINIVARPFYFMIDGSWRLSADVRSKVDRLDALQKCTALHACIIASGVPLI